MDRCKKEAPKVINADMITRCLDLHKPRGDAGRIQVEEGVPFDEVEQLRLEFLNILRIDHLWMLTALTKLSLSNNLIECIENLDALVNLKELDLSFNKIRKIENLNVLENIEILSLFHNEITTLENFDNLTKLLIFTIGRNRIVDRKNVSYLRRFNLLQSVNMEGNPCAEDEDFLIFVSAFLPQICYYQYVRIVDSHRTIGLEKFPDLLQEVLIEESKRKAVLDHIEAQRAEAELHAGSFVEFLGTSYLFDQMYKSDADGKALLLVNAAQESVYLEYKDHFTKCCRSIFELGQQQYKIRKVEVEQFFETIDSAKLKSQQESITKMEEFLVKKADMFERVKELHDSLESDPGREEECNDILQDYSDEYNDLLHAVWKDLMGLELTLYEQMEEVISLFEQSVTDMINYFVENAQGFFTELRNLEQTYFDSLCIEANALQTLVTSNEDHPVPDELKVIMSDKEILSNALGGSHDAHLLAIDLREDTLVSKAKNWLNSVVGSLTRGEINRNRGKVLEINHFLDIQREEFDDLHTNIGIPGALDPDISAVLS